MIFGTIPFWSDDFNQSAGDVQGVDGWAATSGIRFNGSGAIISNVNPGEFWARQTVTAHTADDMAVRATATPGAGAGSGGSDWEVGVACRHSSTDVETGCKSFLLPDGQFLVYDGGSLIGFGSVGAAPTLGVQLTWAMEVVGTQMRCYYNDALVTFNGGSANFVSANVLSVAAGGASEDYFAINTTNANDDTVLYQKIEVFDIDTNVITSVEEHGTSLGSANAMPLPPLAASGDLIIAVVGNDNPSTTNLSASTGWVAAGSVAQQTVGANIAKSHVFARILTGLTGDNILAVTGAAQDYVCVLVRIPAALHGVTDVTTDIKIGAATATTGNADPPSLDAGSVKNWIWLVAGIVDLTTGNTITSISTGYAVQQNVVSASSTSSVAVAVGTQTIAASQTQNPAAFSNTSRNNIAYTIAAPPPVTVQSSIHLRRRRSRQLLMRGSR